MPDSFIDGIYYKMSSWDTWECSLGRFGLRIIDQGKKAVLYPPFEIIISSIFIAISIVVIYKVLFPNKDKLSLLVGVAVIFLISPGIIDCMTGYYLCTAYCFSWLCSVLAAAIVIIIGKRNVCLSIISMVLAAFLLMVSFSIYQAYPVFFVCIVTGALLIRVLDGELTLFKVVTYTLKTGITFGFGVLWYLHKMKSYNAKLGVSLTSGRNFDLMGEIDITEIPGRIATAYKYAYDYFFTDVKINNSFFHRDVANKVILVVSLLCIALVLFHKLRGAKLKTILFHLFVIGALVALYPVFLSLITIMAPGADVYDNTGVLMTPTMNMAYILAMSIGIKAFDIIKDRIQNNAIKMLALMLPTVCICATFVSIVSLTVIAAAGWSYTQYMKEQTLFNINRIISMTDQNGYDVTEYPLAVMGYDYSVPDEHIAIKDLCKGTMRWCGMSWQSSPTYMDIPCIIKSYYGVPVVKPTYEDISKFADTGEYKKMPLFPAKGSVELIEDVIVVKFSEN